MGTSLTGVRESISDDGMVQSWRAQARLSGISVGGVDLTKVRSIAPLSAEALWEMWLRRQGGGLAA